jgi:xylose dehydrogenase (NAD/NADP)
MALDPPASAPLLRWGLLSTARINDALLGADPGKPGRWVAVGSRDGARAERYAADRGLARAHGSYEALLADPDIDAIYNPLPNGLHAEWSIRALQAGKHVLCEKPFSADPADVERTWTVAEQHGLVVAEAFMWRHHPLARRARQLVSDGAIGALRSIHAAFSFPLEDPGDVRWQAALAGGSVMDLGCYCVSGCRTLAGAEPERVRGELVEGGDGVDASFAGVLRFPDGVLATFSCSFAATGRHVLSAVGTAGQLELHDPWHAGRPVIVLTDADGVSQEHEVPSARNSYALELEDFEAAVAGLREPLLGRDDALGQARALGALLASAREAG